MEETDDGIYYTTSKLLCPNHRYFKRKYNRVEFIVARDGLAWFKENILGEYIECSTHNYTMDLAILSLSDHIIISLCTYLWWAG